MKNRIIVATTLVLLMFLTTVSNTTIRVEAEYDLSQVAYYDQVKQEFNLTAQQEQMLKKHGFTIVGMSNDSDSYFYPWQRFEGFYYTKVYGPDLPVFVTTDSILHLFHVVFDCSLRMIENQTFYPMVSEVTQYAFQKSLNDYNTIPHDNSMKYWAIRNATVYFAVARSLISGENVTVPSELSSDVSFFLNEIWAEEPRFVMAGSWQYPGDAVILQYDFTQFTVRGHYLGEPTLERYFQTMMWYGNFPVFIPRINETYSWENSHIDTAAIVYARDILKQNPLHFDQWITLYNVTSALVGESDSINPLSLEVALHNVFGERIQYIDVAATQSGLEELSGELAKPEYEQRILGQALISNNPDDEVRYPIVFQFMGQRYVPDSFMFQMLCWDKTGFNSAEKRRLMPKSLDLFAVLGSERAYQLLTPDHDYENYTENLATLKNTFENLTEDEWFHSSYVAWIYSLQSLVNVEVNNSYPDFMRNLAWQDEKLNTVCGSWSQLRHDTLLYAKQPYIPGLICSYPEAFVEPYPTFYYRMQRLSERTIEAISILSSEGINPVIMDSLQTMGDICQKLETISNKELMKQPLTAEENDFIKQIVWRCGSGGFVGWYVDTIHAVTQAANYTSLLDVPVIADVATFPPGDLWDPPQILHVGVGYVNALVVLYQKSDGTLVAAVGPVFSYYEFPLIGTKRLNDDEWKTMLAFNNRTEYLPEWVKDVYGMGDPLFPEFAPVIMLVAIIVVSTVTLKLKIKIKKKRIAYHR
jgi:hypothetical protein